MKMYNISLLDFYKFQLGTLLETVVRDCPLIKNTQGSLQLINQFKFSLSQATIIGTVNIFFYTIFRLFIININAHFREIHQHLTQISQQFLVNAIK